MNFWKSTLLIVLVLLPTYAVSAQGLPTDNAYDNRDSPVDLLASYYNAINRQDYARAYGYWQNAPKSYADFVSGFADTVSAQVIVQPPTHSEGAAGSIYVQIPTVLVANHQDGTEHLYSGCFVTRKSNLQPPDIPAPDVWHLYSADLTEQPLTRSIPTLLAEACDHTP
ncbi:MAG: hypothetical protein K8J31_22850 [Anaerolineae bacterium]|nr:hypothetical protein [Anaerolineae bacterium]